MYSKFLRIAFAAALGALASGCTSNSANTMSAGAPVNTSAALVAPAAFAPAAGQSGAAQQLSKPYFIDFRARNALSYGHTFVVFGRLDQNGRVPTDSKGVLIPGMTEVAGLHPASTSNVPYTIGHFLPVPSETGPSDGDTEIAYMTAHYRIDLTEEEYRDVVGYIRGLQELLAGLARGALQLQFLRWRHCRAYGPQGAQSHAVPGELHQHAQGNELLGQFPDAPRSPTITPGRDSAPGFFMAVPQGGSGNCDAGRGGVYRAAAPTLATRSANRSP